MSEIVHVPFHGDDVMCVEIDGKPHVILKAAFAAIGLDADRQIKNVRRQEWATCTAVTDVQMPGDDQRRPLIVADVRTFLMALAVIPASRVAESVRPALIAYQREVADVIEAYFTKRHRGFDDPDVLTWDETCAVLRQRYGLDLNPMALIRKLKQAGVLKQNGAPKSKHAHMFWFTGSAYNVHPYMIRTLAVKIANAGYQLDGMRSILQLELELEGVAGPKEIAAQ